MGACPIAQLNSLRFGDINHPRTQWLIKGVVKGIGDYGNTFGIPTVEGEVFFDECYQVNPSVNAMTAGIVKAGETVSATSYGAQGRVVVSIKPEAQEAVVTKNGFVVDDELYDTVSHAKQLYDNVLENVLGG